MSWHEEFIQWVNDKLIIPDNLEITEQRIATIQIDTKTLAIGQGADEALTSAQDASEIGIGLAENARKLAEQIEVFKF
ncbi:protein of unknown function [Shewanella benthica]|uniref:Uncharacterized protein n=1 Tax=Shewanella benthica TaxID=43661 RepID=A0A330MB83_9GAMM|nr:hypothetical protein [Shewanella benthica]SQH77057.1 protein of unknown function [Shewanella benthica]